MNEMLAPLIGKSLSAIFSLKISSKFVRITNYEIS